MSRGTNLQLVHDSKSQIVILFLQFSVAIKHTKTKANNQQFDIRQSRSFSQNNIEKNILFEGKPGHFNSSSFIYIFKKCDC